MAISPFLDALYFVTEDTGTQAFQGFHVVRVGQSVYFTLPKKIRAFQAFDNLCVFKEKIHFF
jgi:hypothetical protein